MTNRLNRRDIWNADDVERIVQRNAKWFSDLVAEGVKATQRAGRPLFTQKIPESERLAALLQAPPEFWERLSSTDPETAAALAASVIRARAQGKIPAEGPRANEVTPEDAQAMAEAAPPPPVPEAGGAEQIGVKGTGTEPEKRIPDFSKSHH